MYLVEILLPLADNSGEAYPEDILRNIQSELADRFGGLTAHTRAPAAGVWSRNGEHQNDDIVIIEVMAPALEKRWWNRFRKRLEALLDQEEIVIRAQKFTKL
jgi:hypothetical protein